MKASVLERAGYAFVVEGEYRLLEGELSSDIDLTGLRRWLR